MGPPQTAERGKGNEEGRKEKEGEKREREGEKREYPVYIFFTN